MLDITVELLEGGTMPSKAHETDSCYDLVAREMYTTPEYIGYKLGVKIQLPDTHDALLFSRSSVSKYHLQQCNGVGVIDSSYVGELEIRFNLAAPNFLHPNTPEFGEPKIFNVGDKVAQLMIREKVNTNLIPGKVSSDTERGEKGFGSSGN